MKESWDRSTSAAEEVDLVLRDHGLRRPSDPPSSPRTQRPGRAVPDGPSAFVPAPFGTVFDPGEVAASGDLRSRPTRVLAQRAAGAVGCLGLSGQWTR